MPLRYLHLKSGAATMDYDGVDLPDMAAARLEALHTISQVLREDDVDHLWHGVPLRLWITDSPGGAGKTLLTLNVSGVAPG
jgi:hypothetical protein